MISMTILNCMIWCGIIMISKLISMFIAVTSDPLSSPPLSSLRSLPRWRWRGWLDMLAMIVMRLLFLIITMTMISFLLASVKISGILDPEQKSIIKCIFPFFLSSFRQSDHWPVGYHGGLDTVGRARPLAGIVPRIFLRRSDFELPGTGSETQGKMLLLYLPPISNFWLCWGLQQNDVETLLQFFGIEQVFHDYSLEIVYGPQFRMRNQHWNEMSLECVTSDVSYLTCEIQATPPSIDKHQPIYELLSPNKCQYQPALVWEVMSCWYLRASCYRAGMIPVSS